MTATICVECSAWTFGGGLCRDCETDREDNPREAEFYAALEERVAARERDRGER